MSDYIDDVFGADGLFAGCVPGYEQRPGQIALARKVDQAMREQGHLLGEGPCGTGKGIAYGVPAAYHVHHHEKKVVIVTANIALQEQLINKDLPMLAKVLPWKFTFALLKGLNNYLCLDQLSTERKATKQAGLFVSEHDQQLQTVMAWADTTETGDKAELPLLPSPQVWTKLSVDSDNCKTDLCKFHDDCLALRAKRAATAANIIVTNYHMLFSHLAVRRSSGKDLVLPKFGILVLDEAHEASEIARDFFGFSVSEQIVHRLATFALDYARGDLADDLRKEAAAFFVSVAKFAKSPAYSCRLKKPGFVDERKLTNALDAFLRFAQDRTEHAAESDVRAEATIVHKSGLATKDRIIEAVQKPKTNMVYWIALDPKGGRPQLKAKPIDVGVELRAELFDKTDSVTLVSATLTTDRTFDLARSELGIPAYADEVIADTPFDFKRQALLVIPADLPEWTEPAWPHTVAEHVRRVVELCNGRTMALFTSYTNLEITHAYLLSQGIDKHHRILRQANEGRPRKDDLPRSEIARIFRQDVGSVLLATSSFWTGIDVPGEALTGLVIDKLPFLSQDDPVVDAIIERDGKYPTFNNYQVPKCIIDLRQGVGRLIRSQKDIGVVVLLDCRLRSKKYGPRIIKSLPAMRETHRLDDIAKFLKRSKP
jgi:ATP-dependent DNA helicase DinG